MKISTFSVAIVRLLPVQISKTKYVNYIDGNKTRQDTIIFIIAINPISSFLLESHHALNRKMFILVRARNNDCEKKRDAERGPLYG